jgi:endonuclease YncB( thermonuclease family)
MTRCLSDTVYFEGDVFDRDHYDRLLRNVWVANDECEAFLLNEFLVREGHALVSTARRTRAAWSCCRRSATSPGRRRWKPRWRGASCS